MQTAVDSAADGDTVLVPVGDCTWTAGIVVSGKGVHLKGETKGGVNITHSAGTTDLIRVTTDTTHHTEISNLTFLAGSVSGSAEYIAVSGSGKPALVHDNYFRNRNFQANCISWSTTGGVIWNNTFESLDGDGSGGGCLQLKGGASNSWTAASTMGTADSNGTANVYIENNVFRKITLQAIDVDDNVRAVIRFNTFDNSGIVYHGADTSPQGARHVELYNNTFVFTGSGSGYNFPLNLNWWVYMRGGTGVVTDNVWQDINSQTWGNKREINLTVQNLRRRAGPYPCWTSYPAPHQVGQSHNGTSSVTDPVYIWGNTGGGSETPLVRDYDPDECGNGLRSSSFIQSGRDYIVGTPKPGYSKYTYPHPLTAGLQPPPAPTLAINDATTAEGATANFTVTLSAPATQAVTVLASTANGTATAGGDYTARTGVTLTFPAGSTTQTFAVTTLADSLSESNENFTVNLSGATNATIADAQGVGTITNVATATPSLSVNDVGVAEGATATFTVSLSAASSQTVTVVAATANGTATAGGDYIARAGVTLTFPAGSTTQTFAVTTLADALNESNENFTVNLSSATNATIADVQGVGTITNVAPALPSLSVSDVSVAEGTTASFTVSLSAASSQTVTVLASTANGTAAAGSDYTSRSSVTITFPAGTTAQAFAVTTLADAVTDNGETFTVNLSGAANATIADAQGVGTIVDTGPAAPPSITTQPANQVAGLGRTATFSVTATGSAPLSYQWSKDGAPIGGATGGTYTTPALTFADNASIFSVTVSNSFGSAASTGATLLVSALPGPVASYNFDEGSGTTLIDRSGHGNDGAVSNATWSTAGKTGSSLTFNGTNSQVTIPDSATLDLSTGMTLEAWVHPTALGGWRTVLLKEATGDLSYALYASNDGSLPNSFIGGTHADGTSALPLNSWTHLAATFDGATLRLFLNGVPVRSVASGNIVPSSGSLRIGGNGIWGEFFSGRIDDIRIYNRALSQTEIQADMNAPGSCP